MSHLRQREGGEQATTVVELFFDLVYVFAVPQLSHLLIGTLSWSDAAHAAFLLVVIWWAWIYTTWMVNWFDPGSTPVRLVLILVMLVSLVMAAAVPEAFGPYAVLFAGAYAALQVGRNIAGAAPAPRSSAASDIRAHRGVERRLRRAVGRRSDTWRRQAPMAVGPGARY